MCVHMFRSMPQLSLLNYFKQKKLPDPDGPLLESVYPCAITFANREVLEEMKKMKNQGNMHGPSLSEHLSV